MRVAGWACLTMYWKGFRYSFRMVFSEATELPMKRKFSELFNAKCLRDTATPFDWTPVTTEEHVDPVKAALLGDSLPHFPGVLRVPAGGRGDRRGEGCSGLAFAHAVIAALLLDPEAVGTVRHAQGRDAQPGDGVGVHEVGAGHQGRFLLHRQFLHQPFDVHMLPPLLFSYGSSIAEAVNNVLHPCTIFGTMVMKWRAML